MDYYLSDDLSFQVSKKIGLGEVEGFTLVTRSEYYRAISTRFSSEVTKTKDRCLSAVKLTATRVSEATTKFKGKVTSAVKAFKE